ncbi:hypothetical protein P7D43_16705 [Enterococcus avium]|uniref:XRE family transcriptional regulator n=1 Tax=Enterococcus avium TaxID=33945 RepID=A0AAW8RVM0_ENTAV|nr:MULTISPECIES: hypothetical protein [Enterococcus]MDB1686245.1 hypothetical protein [Enterococcus durans]MDT2399198.1 hypothetical protein [Enterococcus avium]MDT2404008.1 hypothetical protein [Enterococcus avium]MDT2423022.1 hypothetical protein [Enterococcus avium]
MTRNEKGGEKMKSNVFLGQLKMQGHNIEWLLNQMTERGVSITKSTIYKKLRGESEFNASEIKVISDIMQYSEKEMYDIFFEELVS